MLPLFFPPRIDLEKSDLFPTLFVSVFIISQYTNRVNYFFTFCVISLQLLQSVLSCYYKKEAVSMNEFRTIFKQLRQEHQISQTELAAKLGISRSAVSMYERGEREPDLATLEKIRKLFDVDMNYLLGHGEKSPVSSAAPQEPDFQDLQSLLARNGNKLTLEQKQELIRTLLS